MVGADIGTCKISAKSDNLVTSWAKQQGSGQRHREALYCFFKGHDPELCQPTVACQTQHDDQRDREAAGQTEADPFEPRRN